MKCGSRRTDSNLEEPKEKIEKKTLRGRRIAPNLTILLV
jgi:hypothetical protein